MAQINVTNLTFCYEGSFDNIFENVSFSIDTDWRLGFIGRNGKGKTTFLNLLLGKLDDHGAIHKSVLFDYFPYGISDAQRKRPAVDFIEEIKPGCELWKVYIEMDQLKTSTEVLFRAFDTLSFGEQTKVMLGILFAGDNDFLLIDEPTNHLDQNAREAVKNYLKQKKGFILVSHDRDLLDACIDHVLVLNRKTIEIQTGNFSSWWENKQRKDHFLLMENEKHARQITQLKKSAERSNRWATINENTKIGFDPIKEHERMIDTRAYIGAKTKKMQSRVKQYERRIENEISQQEGLLLDIEKPVDLKLCPLQFHKEQLLLSKDFELAYEDSKPVLQNFSFSLYRGERVFLYGENGCGKSSFIKAILNQVKQGNQVKQSCQLKQNNIIKESNLVSQEMKCKGELSVASGLIISYVNQDTSFLQGSVKDFCSERKLDESLFCAILRQLDMERVQFAKRMEEYSEGQKKKVIIAASLMKPAHLYIWDEPLNYIDVFSRIQIENLVLRYQPTMLIVDHDIRFQEKIATRTVKMGS